MLTISKTDLFMFWGVGRGRGGGCKGGSDDRCQCDDFDKESSGEENAPAQQMGLKCQTANYLPIFTFRQQLQK
jgi:hypothetical protein